MYVCVHAITESSSKRRPAFFSIAPQACGGSNAAEDSSRLCTKYMGLHLGSVEPDMRFSIRIYHLCSRIQFRENIPATFLVCDGWDASTVWVAQNKVHVFPGTCLLIGQSATFCSFRDSFWHALTDSLCSVLTLCGERLRNWSEIFASIMLRSTRC